MTINRKSFENGVQFAWDSTSLVLAMECPRKYYYRMILNLVPKGDKNVHLLFGGIYASALELFYKRRALGDSIEDALRAAVRDALERSWNKEKNEPYIFDDANKTRSTLLRTIIWYVDQFAVEDKNSIQTYHLRDGSPAVELSFSVPLTNDILYCGHLDRVVQYGNGLYWMDQKTTKSTIGPYFFESFRLSNQFIGYTWAGQMILHEPLQGGIIDGAQIAQGFSRFERAPIPFNAGQLQEWHEDTIEHIRTMQDYTRRGAFPMNRTSCGNYNGCEYKELCTRSPAIRDRFIQGNFVHPEKPWDPLVAR